MRSGQITFIDTIKNVTEDQFEKKLQQSKDDFIKKILAEEVTLDSYLDDIKKRNEISKAKPKVKTPEQIKKDQEKIFARIKEEMTDSNVSSINDPSIQAFFKSINTEDFNLFTSSDKLADFYYMKYNFRLMNSKNVNKDAAFRFGTNFFKGFEKFSNSFRFTNKLSRTNVLGEKVQTISGNFRKLRDEFNKIQAQDSVDNISQAKNYDASHRFTHTVDERLGYFFPEIYPQLIKYRNALYSEFQENSDDDFVIVEKPSINSQYDAINFEKKYPQISAELNKLKSSPHFNRDNYYKHFFTNVLPLLTQSSSNKKLSNRNIESDILQHFKDKLESNELANKENKSFSSKKEEEKLPSGQQSTGVTTPFLDELVNEFNTNYQKILSEKVSYLSTDQKILFDKEKRLFIEENILNVAKNVLKEAYPNIVQELNLFHLKMEGLNFSVNTATNEFNKQYQQVMGNKIAPIEQATEGLLRKYEKNIKGIRVFGTENSKEILIENGKDFIKDATDLKLLQMINLYESIVSPKILVRKQFYNNWLSTFIQQFTNSNQIKNQKQPFYDLAKAMFTLEVDFSNNQQGYSEIYFSKIINDVVNCDPSLHTRQAKQDKLTSLQNLIRKKLASTLDNEVLAIIDRAMKEVDKQNADALSASIGPISAPPKAYNEKLYDKLSDIYDQNFPQSVMTPEESHLWEMNKQQYIHGIIDDSIKHILSDTPLAVELSKFNEQIIRLLTSLNGFKFGIETASSKLNTTNINEMITLHLNNILKRQNDFTLSGMEPMKAILILEKNKRLNTDETNLVNIIKEYNNIRGTLNKYISDYIQYLQKKFPASDQKSLEKLINDLYHMQSKLAGYDASNYYINTIVPDMLACDPTLNSSNLLANKLDEIETKLVSFGNNIMQQASQNISQNAYEENPENISGLINLPPSAPELSIHEHEPLIKFMTEPVPASIDTLSQQELADMQEQALKNANEKVEKIVDKHAAMGKATEKANALVDKIMDDNKARAVQEEAEHKKVQLSHEQKQETKILENSENKPEDVKKKDAANLAEKSSRIEIEEKIEIKATEEKEKSFAPLSHEPPATSLWKDDSKKLKDFAIGELWSLTLDQLKKLIQNGSIDDINNLNPAAKTALLNSLDRLNKSAKESGMQEKITQLLVEFAPKEKISTKPSTGKKGVAE